MRLPKPLLMVAGLAPVAAFAFLAVVLALGLKEDPSRLPSVLVGKPVPNFALGPVRPGDVGFSRDDIRGKVVLINIYGSWCVVCREEHPMLMELAAKGVPIYGIDWKDTPADGAETLLRSGDPYVRVGSDQNGRLALDLGVSGAPETFVVDRTGRIRFKQVGAITSEVWRDQMGPLIRKLEAER